VLGPEDRKGTTVRRASEMNEEVEKKPNSHANMYNSSGVGNFTALDEIIEIANKFFIRKSNFLKFFLKNDQRR